ncbi:MAG TPA: IclR family transcriptional regulator [Syntrophorhabdales bacterium]|nr:IclR family transcriptional regulator [Syntrophorhabdales bacterium]
MMRSEKKTADQRYLVPAVEQASRVLLALAGARSSHMSLTEICAEVGIHKSKAFSILHTLQKFGFVQRNSDGKGYALGPGLVRLSRRVLDNLNAPRLAEPILEKLAHKAGGTAILGLIADKGVFVVAKQEGNHDIGYTIRIGTRFPLTYGSHGKAIAAFLPPSELDKLLQQKKLYFYGESGAFNRKRLEKELGQVRRDGFALDLGEMRPGLSAVAAPVFGPGAGPIGYIVVIGLVSEEAARQLGPTIAQAAKSLSRQLGADMKLVSAGD